MKSIKIPLKKIRWLASYPKSGNTWARLFLNAYVSGKPVDINNAWGQYATSDLRWTSYQRVLTWPMAITPQPALFYARPAALQDMIAEAGTNDVCLKTHNHHGEMYGMPLIPPEMTLSAVYLIRDPRDVLVSYAAHSGQRIDKTLKWMSKPDAAMSPSPRDQGLFHVLHSWNAHVRSWTVGVKNFPITVIRYEDMIEHPEEIFAAIVEANGLDVDRERLLWAIEETAFDKLQAAEASGGFLEATPHTAFFRNGKSGVWREELTAAQIQQAEEKFGLAMKQFDYELSGEIR